MNNSYRELKERQQKEVNDFPMFFAFSNEQFEKGMKKLGLDPTDTDKIYKFGSTGGFYKKSDSEKLKNMFDRHNKEMDQAINNDATGEGFIYDMFNYELANHEYCITYDIDDTLNALGLTIEEINNSKALLHGFNKSRNNQINY